MTADVVAPTAQGRVRGARDGPALRFLGIPFAESPATAGRFGAPAAPGRWDGIRDALSYGATSPQPDRGVTLIPEPIIAGDNELNLNVFTPDLAPARLPVLVWIHGGGFFGGGNASPWYRGGPFARDGVVLVSINYRLGAEGFLEVPGAPANRAVRDWVRALEWVQENIAAFGGDPGRVTIAGQSAGGAACAVLLGVPAARGLFRGAACMSGGPALMQTADGVRAVAARMAGRLGVPALDRAALEQMPAETILAAQEAVTAAGPGAHDVEALAALLGRRITLPWAPWPDGDVVTEDPLRAAASPRHREVALLVGATAHEFNMAWIPADWITADVAAEGLARAGVAAPLAAAYLGQAGRGRAPRWGRPSPTGRSGSRPSDWPRPRPKRAARPGPTTSAGRRRPGRWPAWPSTASTSRSSSTHSASRVWRKRPARLRPRPWLRTCTARWSASSPAVPPAGRRTEQAAGRSWCSATHPGCRKTRSGRSSASGRSRAVPNGPGLSRCPPRVGRNAMKPGAS